MEDKGKKILPKTSPAEVPAQAPTKKKIIGTTKEAVHEKKREEKRKNKEKEKEKEKDKDGQREKGRSCSKIPKRSFSRRDTPRNSTTRYRVSTHQVFLSTLGVSWSASSNHGPSSRLRRGRRLIAPRGGFTVYQGGQLPPPLDFEK
jgi:hypothetical protein